MTLFLAAVLTALSISALCSLLEATLLSLTSTQIAELSVQRPKVAAIWHRFKENLEKPIAVILIVNTSAHTIGATVAGAEFERLFGEQWLALFSLGLTYLMLQFTEILPKTLGVTHNRALASVIAGPLSALVRILSPVLWFIHWVNRPFERRKDRVASRTIDEIQALTSIARTAGAIDLQQAQMIHAASRLPELRVRQIMTPRIDAAYLSLDQPIEEVLRIVRSSPWSRFPLCDGDLDHTLGLIHVRDLFNHLELQLDTVNRRPVRLEESPKEEHQEMQTRVVGTGDLNLRSIMRPIIIVPEQAPVSGLLRQFQESRTHMAILVDEYGVAEGIVTLEDILEEVVGEIEDEFDRKSAAQISVEGDTYVIRGSVPLHELQDRIGLALEAADVDTLGGYIVQELDRLPKVGDSLEVGNYTARITSVDRWRVTGVELRKRTGPAG